MAHEGHFMYEKTLNILRQSNWFPGMAEMVREYVESCKACQASDPSTGQEPIGKEHYLHTFIDQYTKYPVVEVCKSTSWEQMEPMMENALGLFGNVERVASDGGPPYDSREFRKMAKRMGFYHHITTPENPQANGFVEVFQKVLVKMVHTAVVERRLVHRYLASYRAAPQKKTGKSPYELMFNRKMMTKLPQAPIKPNQKLDQEVRKKHDAAKAKQKEYADHRRRAKEKVIKVGDEVLVQQKKEFR